MKRTALIYMADKLISTIINVEKVSNMDNGQTLLFKNNLLVAVIPDGYLIDLKDEE